MSTTDNFLSCIRRIAKCTQGEARKVLERYRQDKILKFDSVNGSWSVVHGAFLDADVIQRAIKGIE